MLPFALNDYAESPYREQQPKPPPRGGAGAKVGVAGVVTLGVLLLKFGKFVLLPLKLLAGGKFWLTGLSMLAMVWSQAVFHGWAFAIGFVLVIFVHEMGHALEIRRSGLDASWPVFIPFVGAFITMRGRVLDVATEARVGIAGPVAGGLASLACLALWDATDASIFLALAYTGFFLNLFNLLPVRPLDGGRVFAAVSPKAGWFGLGLLGLGFLYTASPLLIFIAIMAVGGILAERRRPPEEAARYYALSPRARLAWAGAYFGLVLALAAGMAFAFGEMPS